MFFCLVSIYIQTHQVSFFSGPQISPDAEFVLAWRLLFLFSLVYLFISLIFKLVSPAWLFISQDSHMRSNARLRIKCSRCSLGMELSNFARQLLHSLCRQHILPTDVLILCCRSYILYLYTPSLLSISFIYVYSCILLFERILFYRFNNLFKVFFLFPTFYALKNVKK